MCPATFTPGNTLELCNGQGLSGNVKSQGERMVGAAWQAGAVVGSLQELGVELGLLVVFSSNPGLISLPFMDILCMELNDGFEVDNKAASPFILVHVQVNKHNSTEFHQVVNAMQTWRKIVSVRQEKAEASQRRG